MRTASDCSTPPDGSTTSLDLHKRLRNYIPATTINSKHGQSVSLLQHEVGVDEQQQLLYILSFAERSTILDRTTIGGSAKLTPQVFAGVD